jgi:Ca2+-binding RTX toxin-like protein
MTDAFGNIDSVVNVENFRGSEFDDDVTGDSAANVFLGFAGDDLLRGMGGNDDLQGYSGNDTLDGGAGHDGLYGAVGNDIMSGGAGDDTLWGGDGADAIEGGTGRDFLFGGTGDDVLRGDDGVDFLFGNDGDDTLLGGAGDDVLRGDSGADRFVFSSILDGNDVIADFDSAQGDVVDFDALFDSLGVAEGDRAGALDFSDSAAGITVAVTTADASFSVTFSGLDAFSLADMDQVVLSD